MADILEALPSEVDAELEEIGAGWGIDPTPRTVFREEYYPGKYLRASYERMRQYALEMEKRRGDFDNGRW